MTGFHIIATDFFTNGYNEIICWKSRLF